MVKKQRMAPLNCINGFNKFYLTVCNWLSCAQILLNTVGQFGTCAFCFCVCVFMTGKSQIDMATEELPLKYPPPPFFKTCFPETFHFISSVPWLIGLSRVQEINQERDPLPVFSAGGCCEQFWQGQGCPLFWRACSITSADHGIARSPRCPEVWFWRGCSGAWHGWTTQTSSLDSRQRRFLWAHKGNSLPASVSRNPQHGPPLFFDPFCWRFKVVIKRVPLYNCKCHFKHRMRLAGRMCVNGYVMVLSSFPVCSGWKITHIFVQEIHNSSFCATSIQVHDDFIYISFLQVLARNQVCRWNNNFEKLPQSQIFACGTLWVKIHPYFQRSQGWIFTYGRHCESFTMEKSWVNFHPLCMLCRVSSLNV